MKKVGKTMKQFLAPLFVFMPGVIYLFINCYIPMFGIQIAFRQYNARDGIYGSPWCGFKNFEFLFRTNDAFIMIRNTLLYNPGVYYTGDCTGCCGSYYSQRNPQ